jgi:hypothetical protein
MIFYHILTPKSRWQIAQFWEKEKEEICANFLLTKLAGCDIMEIWALNYR